MYWIKLVVVAAAVALVAGIVAGVWRHMTAAPAPVPSLHSVWCVRDGYPADLAVPFVVGPGTGLTGCPLGDRLVSEP